MATFWVSSVPKKLNYSSKISFTGALVLNVVGHG